MQQIKEEEKSAHGFYYRNSIRANTLIFRALGHFCLFNNNYLILLKISILPRATMLEPMGLQILTPA